MADNELAYSGKPYKIIDHKREQKIGIVATSLSDFMTKGNDIFVIYLIKYNMHLISLINIDNIIQYYLVI